MIQEKSGSNWSEIQRMVKNFADQIIQIRLDSSKSLVFATQVASELKVDDKVFSNLFLSEYGVILESVFMMR